MRQTVRQGEQEDVLYRRMKVSKVGVMLLVRLYADLCEQPVSKLRPLTDPMSMDLARMNLEPNSRLSVTLDWLERHFGSANVARALSETAHEILESIPGVRGEHVSADPRRNGVRP